MRLEREARDLAAGGHASDSNVDDMRNQLMTLGAPVWVTNSQLWLRLIHAEARRELQKRDEAWLADCARELTEAGGQEELRVPRAPEDPTADEHTRHEVTHLPYQPWCVWCTCSGQFEMAFCYLLQVPKRRHQLGGGRCSPEPDECSTVNKV